MPAEMIQRVLPLDGLEQQRSKLNQVVSQVTRNEKFLTSSAGTLTVDLSTGQLFRTILTENATLAFLNLPTFNQNPIVSIAYSFGTLTATVALKDPHTLTVGEQVTIAGASPAGFNGSFVVSAIPTTKTFQYIVSGLSSGTTGATGSAIYYILTRQKIDIELVVKQAASGGPYTFTFPAAVKWAGGSAPTMTATASRTDLFQLYSIDGGTTWFGRIFGQNFNI